MELENLDLQEESKSPLNSDVELPGILDRKARSPHRLHYEAQVEVIKKQLGDLEKIRGDLGLSQRKICQLLMVDPSAWTRWTKKGESAPPHIYRALQWYMILQEKLPGLTPQYFVGKDPEVLHQAALQRIFAETQKRQEFEEAFSVQALKLESGLLEIKERNQSLLESKTMLERQVTELKTSIRHNRVVFFLLAIAGLCMMVATYFQFLK